MAETEKTQYLMHPETGELKAVSSDEVTPHSRKGWVGIQKAAYDRLVGTGTPGQRPPISLPGVLDQVQAVIDKFPDAGLTPSQATTILAQLYAMAR